MHCLFIYGTLKRGFPNFTPFMDKALYIKDATTKLSFPLVIGGKYYSPCLIDEPGIGHHVSGELFDVAGDDLKKLDQLEATHLPNGYRRISIDVFEAGSIEPRKVWTYAKPRDVIEGIHSQPLREYRLDPRYIVIDKR